MPARQNHDSVGKRLSRVIFQGFLIVLVSSMALNGCSQQKASMGKEVYFLDFGTPEEIQRMSPLIKEFEQNHPDIRVKVEYVTGGTYQKLVVQLAGGTAPDVVYINDTAYPDLVARGVFQPLEPFISAESDFNLDDFRSEALRFGTLDGELYFLPPLSGTFILYYNRDLFDEAGIPYPEDGWTWEEFREVCKKLTVDKDGDGKIDQYALAGWGLLGWYPMILQNGGKIISEDGKRCLIDSPEAVEALEFVRQLYTVDKVIVSGIHAPGMAGMGGAMMMTMSKTAMATGDFGAHERFAKINWDIVALPERKGGRRVFHGGCWAYGITSTAKYPASAWELVKFLTSEEVQRDWVKGLKPTGMPTRRALIVDFKNQFSDKNIESYVYAVGYPNYEFQIKNYRQIMDVLGREIDPVIGGVIPGDLKEVCVKASKQINEILKGNN